MSSAVDVAVDAIQDAEEDLSNYYFKTWLLFTKKQSPIEPEELRKRLMDYQSLISSVSGLTALRLLSVPLSKDVRICQLHSLTIFFYVARCSGFAYIVSRSGVTFGDNVLSHDLFGFFITTSFMCSLGATLLSTLLYGVANILGPEGTKEFVKKFYWLPSIPRTLCLLGVLFMLISQMPSIQYSYSGWVYRYSLVLGIIAIFAAAILYFYVMVKMQDILQKTIDNLGKKKKAQVANGQESGNDDDPNRGLLRGQ